VSRNGYVFKSWPTLAATVAQAVRCRSAILDLDGEICWLNPDGRSDFYGLLFRRGQPHFYAFDVLMVDREDLRALPLLERKRRLLEIMPRTESRLLYLDHIAECGRDLYRAACERDLEGIVGKWACGMYQSDPRGTSWLKIKNPEYSQVEGRHELFDARGERPMLRVKLPTLSLRLA
jgi:bifunctional non-homologous end joining protein LigD